MKNLLNWPTWPTWPTTKHIHSYRRVYTPYPFAYKTSVKLVVLVGQALFKHSHIKGYSMAHYVKNNGPMAHWSGPIMTGG